MDRFVDMVRAGAVSQPHQPSFTSGKWRTAYESVDAPSEADQHLFVDGNTLFDVFEALRAELRAAQRPYMRTRQAARWAIGVSNRDYVVLEQAQRRHVESQAGSKIVAEAQLAARLPVGPDGMPLDVAGLLGGKVDAVRFPLWDALRTGSASAERPDGEDGLAHVGHILRLAGYYEAVEGLWYQCLYAGYRLTERSEFVSVAPHNMEQGVIQAVSEHRVQALNMESVHHAMRLWEGKKYFREMVRRMQPKVRVNERGRPLRLIWPDRDSPPEPPLLMQLAAEEMYWTKLITEPLPTLPAVSIRNLLNAWQVVACLAHGQVRTVPQDTGINTLQRVSKFAPSVSRAELIRLFEQFGLPAAKCGPVLEALTYPQNPTFQTDPWYYPLVEWSAGEYVVHFPVAMTANLIRAVEFWMERYGIDLSRRGKAFEDYTRDQMTSWTMHSHIRGHSSVIAKPVVLRKGEVAEEVDIVVTIGRLVLICECKCALFPATPGEMYRQTQRLREASAQVRRKVAFAENNREVLEAVLGHALHPEPTIVPVIITNLHFHVGFESDGVCVVDEYVMHRALVEGAWEFLIDGATGRPATRTILYSSIESAEANIPAFLLRPPYIRNLRRYIRWSHLPLPQLPKLAKPFLQSNLIVDLSKIQDEVNGL